MAKTYPKTDNETFEDLFMYVFDECHDKFIQLAGFPYIPETDEEVDEALDFLEDNGYSITVVSFVNPLESLILLYKDDEFENGFHLVPDYKEGGIIAIEISKEHYEAKYKPYVDEAEKE